MKKRRKYDGEVNYSDAPPGGRANYSLITVVRSATNIASGTSKLQLSETKRITDTHFPKQCTILPIL